MQVITHRMKTGWSTSTIHMCIYTSPLYDTFMQRIKRHHLCPYIRMLRGRMRGKLGKQLPPIMHLKWRPTLGYFAGGGNYSACRADQCGVKFGGLLKLTFLTNCSLSELIFCLSLGFLNWILSYLSWFLGLEHEKLPNLGIFSENFENFVIFS